MNLHLEYMYNYIFHNEQENVIFGGLDFMLWFIIWVYL